MLAWVTVIAALIYLGVSVLGYLKRKTVADLSWIVSSLGILLTAIALATIGVGILGNPAAAILGTLWPSFLALGILYEKGEFAGIKDVWRYYLYLIVVILIIIAIGAAANIGVLITGPEVFLHVISGLIIVFLPLIEFLGGRWDYRYLFFTLGGIVIGIGGISLAIVITGTEMMGITLDLVLVLLHPLLIISTLLTALGVYLVTQKE